MQQKPRLLIVEDEPAILQGLIDVFVYHGYDVDSASDGLEGLNQAQNGREKFFVSIIKWGDAQTDIVRRAKIRQHI